MGFQIKKEDRVWDYFDKKICDICGGENWVIGKSKNWMTEICVRIVRKKLSPWFEERRHSTVEDIKRQLEYREKKKSGNGLVYNPSDQYQKLQCFY